MYMNNNLPTQILRFFAIDLSISPDNSPLKTVEDFLALEDNYEKLDIILLVKILNKLKHEGLLLSIGTASSAKSPIPNETLIAINYNEAVAQYGSYNYIVNGFRDIVNNFKESVFPIVIKLKDGSFDIGTGFLVGNIYTIITAKHVVEKAEHISIITPTGKIAKVREVVFSNNKDVDIALICLSDNSFSNSKPFNAIDGEILEDVLTIGYPPLPGFDAFQIYELSTINNKFKTSRGQIIGNESAYIDSQEYLIINAKVKGGNSGSPVINNKGNVVGLVVQIPMDINNARELDKLGYGIVTPTNEIRKLLVSDDYTPDIVVYKCENTTEGVKIIK